MKSLRPYLPVGTHALSRKLCTPILALLSVIGVMHNSHGAVIYRETFGNASGGNLSLNAATNWQVFVGSGASDNSSSAAGTAVANGLGKPTDLGNIGTEDPTASQTNGFAYASPGASASIALFTTSEYAISDPLADNATFSWYAGNNTTSVTQRLAVQVNGNWYATDSAFTSAAMSGSNFTTSAELKTFTYTLDASSWRDLTFVEGSSLSLASSARTVDLPTGAITAFGIYMENPSNTIGRFDTFAVDAIPEPSGVTLLLTAAVGMGRIAYRRKQRS